MPETFSVRLEKERLVFSAAHFITYGGAICERLHGHNYRVFAELFGSLDENQYVIDFIALRDALAALCDELDHRVLLPTRHPLIRVTADEREVEARFEERRWVFPRGDCVLLPVANTTAELLARHLAGRLVEAIQARLGWRPARLRFGVDENFGQWAIYEWADA